MDELTLTDLSHGLFHQLLRYYRLKGCYAYERVLVGIAAAIGM